MRPRKRVETWENDSTMTNPESVAATTCYRHPDRVSGIRCQRCDRYICPSCMNSASVGFHCPECMKSGKQKVHTSQSLLNGRPIATQVLLGLNVAAFLVSLLLGDTVTGGRAIDGLLDRGALNGFDIDAGGEWYRIFTSGFLHYGALHLAFNMYALWLLGPQFERTLGAPRMVLSYLAALVGGSFGALLVTPDAFTAGASGAIYGLFAILVVAQRAAGRSIFDSNLGLVLGLNFALTFGIRGVSIGGHLGGFAAGLLAGWVIYELPRRTKLPKWGTEGLLVGIVVAGFAGALWAATTWADPIF